MSQVPTIRLLGQDDLKMVRYQIGLSVMGPLAVATNKGCLHPLTLAVWIACSSTMIQIMNWWPTRNGPLGIWGMLSPIPALAACAVPVMFFFDWHHRPTFEKALHDALTAVDMRNPLKHYTLSSASGFYILEYNKKSIGLIALDASPPHSASTASKLKADATAETAIIRHFFVEEAYRVAGVQADLLEYAVSRAFAANSSPRPHRVRVVSSDLESYKADTLHAANFHPISSWDSTEPQEWKVGVYGWRNRWVEVTREEWAKRDDKDARQS